MEKYRSHTKIVTLKYQLQHGMKSLNYLMNLILYQIFKITLEKHEAATDNPLIMIYVKKINRIMFKINRDFILNF